MFKADKPAANFMIAYGAWERAKGDRKDRLVPLTLRAARAVLTAAKAGPMTDGAAWVYASRFARDHAKG
jgi:hypothetical protein